MEACWYENLEFAKLILQRGADANLLPNPKRKREPFPSSLHVACHKGNVKLVMMMRMMGVMMTMMTMMTMTMRVMMMRVMTTMGPNQTSTSHPPSLVLFVNVSDYCLNAALMSVILSQMI